MSEVFSMKSLQIIPLYKLTKEYKSAISLSNETIIRNIDDPQGYFVLSEIFLEQGDFISALENIIISISKLERDEGYYITNVDDSTKELYELYFLKGEIGLKLGLDKLYCRSTANAIKLYELSDYQFEDKYLELIEKFKNFSECEIEKGI